MNNLPRSARRDNTIRTTVMEVGHREPSKSDKHLYQNHPEYLFVGQDNFFRYFQTVGGIHICRLCKEIIIEGGGTAR